MQQDLFGGNGMPEGFSYAPDFITAEEEADLIEHVRQLDLAPYKYQGFEAKRLVRDFGDGGEPLPPWVEELAMRAEDFFKFPDKLSSAHIIYYPVGTPIGWHRDSPPHDIVVGVSLNSAVRFRLRRELPGGKWERFERIVEPRSVVSHLRSREIYLAAFDPAGRKRTILGHHAHEPRGLRRCCAVRHRGSILQDLPGTLLFA